MSAPSTETSAAAHGADRAATGTRITHFRLETYRVETQPYRWRDGLPQWPGGPVFQRLLRVGTDAGIEGFVWLSNSPVSEALIEQFVAPRFCGYDPFLREKIWAELWELDRLEEFPVYLLGFLDVALWDIQAKALGVPVYKLLGGHKTRAKAYASTVTFESPDDYLRAVDHCLGRGYRAIKLHVWGRLNDDIRLIRTVRRHVGSDVELMLDGSGGYNLDEAIRLGRALEDEGYLWFEEPIRESSLQVYERLCSTLDMPVLAAECTDGCHYNASDWVRLGACDHLRTSWSYKGGFTGALKVAHLAEAFQLRSDVHGGDHASLALVCALPNSDYFESMYPDACFPDATLSGPIAPGGDGWVCPSERPGIGWEPDPDKLVEVR